MEIFVDSTKHFSVCICGNNVAAHFFACVYQWMVGFSWQMVVLYCFERKQFIVRIGQHNFCDWCCLFKKYINYPSRILLVLIKIRRATKYFCFRWILLFLIMTQWCFFFCSVPYLWQQSCNPFFHSCLPVKSQCQLTNGRIILFRKEAVDC